MWCEEDFDEKVVVGEDVEEVERFFDEFLRFLRGLESMPGVERVYYHMVSVKPMYCSGDERVCGDAQVTVVVSHDKSGDFMRSLHTIIRRLGGNGAIGVRLSAVRSDHVIYGLDVCVKLGKFKNIRV